jgi:hypothetical protein
MIQLFEEFTADEAFSFTTPLTWYSSGVDHGAATTSVYKAPEPLNITQGQITWEIKIAPNKRGLTIEDIRIKSLNIILEHEETEEETPMDISQEELDPLKTTYELNRFPLYLKDISITMNGSMEPKDWEIELTIGGTDDY